MFSISLPTILFISVGVLCLIPTITEAQFPTICVENATLPDAVCCPTPADSNFTCGGKHRGKCKLVSKQVKIKEKWNATRFDGVPSAVMQDDRINWPSRFFTYTCDCDFNYDGPACDRCAPGWTGPHCLSRVPLRVRRNVLNLTLEEQHLFRDVLNASKHTPSSYSVMSIADGHSADPITKAKLRVYNVSVYDFFVYQHFYATRSTMFDTEMKVCSANTENALNFAYGGPAFLPWHRYHLHHFEEELARIAETQFNVTDFSLSYWDWTGKNSCEVCTDDLIGGFSNPNTNVSMEQSDIDDIIRYDDETDISSLSPFSKFRTLCSDNSDPDACHTCDLETQAFDDTPSYLRRKYSSDVNFQRLPTQEEMDLTMFTEEYDTFPYDNSSANSSFRNCLEGYATLGLRDGPFNMNNLVRNFLNGTWNDASASPNDPLYILHYAFVDKLFNLFIRSKNQTDRKYPMNNTRFGHGGFEPLVPSFPPKSVDFYMIDSKLLGYTYDDDLAGSTVMPPARPKQSVTAQSIIPLPKETGSLVGVVLACVACVGLVSVLIATGMHVQRRRNSRLFQYVPMDGETAPVSSQKKPSNSPGNCMDIRKSEKIPLLRIDK